MRKSLALICLVLIVFTIYEISVTYSKYVSEATGTAQNTVGAWVIHVNDNDISNGSVTHSFTIDNLTFLESDYVAPDKFAPNSEAYFDIDIDPTGTSVAVRFDATLDFSELNLNDSINFDYACKVVNDVEDTSGMIRTARNTFTGLITLDEVQAGTVTTARFYLIWDGSDNAADMILGTVEEGVSLNMPIELTISQYQGETITEYQPTP